MHEVKTSDLYSIEGVRVKSNISKVDQYQNLEPRITQTAFNFHQVRNAKNESKLMSSSQRRSELDMCKVRLQEQFKKKHDKVQHTKLQRIISTYHKSGIQGVDDPLNSDGHFYKSNVPEIEQMMSRKQKSLKDRQKNATKAGGTSYIFNLNTRGIEDSRHYDSVVDLGDKWKAKNYAQNKIDFADILSGKSKARFEGIPGLKQDSANVKGILTKSQYHAKP